MKSIKLIFVLSVFLSIFSCRKSDENLEVDLSKYNPDITASGDLDRWISKEFTDPYNIEVVYRFNRDLGNTTRDIAPIDLSKVTPIMTAVLDVYLRPYEKIAGKHFIRRYTPKQFVLFGSVSYNTNGSVTLGTADGGRRVVLYDANNFNENDGNGVKRDMRTIHHEFTHILNQTVKIPEDYEQITKSDYVADWTNSVYTEAEAKALGFVSRYSRSSYTEDFAEVTAHLLAEGQIWFDNYIATAPSPLAGQKLRKKEEIVIRYFKEYFDIDFRALQAEVQKVLKEKYAATDPADLSQTLAAALNGNKISTINYTPTAAHYTTYGNSAAFNTIFNNMVTAAKANLVSGLGTGWANAVIPYVEFRFTDAENMVLRIAFKQTSTATTTYFSDYYFKMSVNTGTGITTFTKSMVGGVHYNGNGAYTLAGFEQYILPYLTNREFVASWLPSTIPSTSPLYRSLGGFYVQGASTNYVYGPIVLK